MKKKLFIGFIVLVLVVLGVLYQGYQKVQTFAHTPLRIDQDTLFKLPAGTGRAGLEALLVRDKLIAGGRYFPWLLQLRPDLTRFKAGTYRLTKGMTVLEMLQLLNSGKEAQFSVRFVEGSRLQDWIQTLKAAPYLKHTLKGKTPQEVMDAVGAKDIPSLEGWLYPDTYHYTAGAADLSLVKRAYQLMKQQVDPLWEGRDKTLPYKTVEELVTMASIIEKETGVGEERGKVASVFVNRLRIGMRLQTDPTVIYGLGDDYNGNLTRKNLEQPTAYNTYVISGLPPTPIAMPGKASLKAAAHPDKTPYLYFVADGKGGHVFNTNLQSHNQSVRDYLKVMRAKKNEK
ncbi:endolytic transglycosylase MltG [Enterobacillus tribolii]|uniref:Endolytic murein transglycosylase n=1 Tax=Enterobacillus tribolii TaxID=1487935 RepID=A0A370R437_9GAMM|nr:endolytic transglycosylase MltG [Enterobacillus tribolii]MBW7983898.1 endolytic transglycosylase MltG [Enterobacillus tribolii]RDK96835.1 UPF0755 protein [Enterobacillus tribolii]